MNDKANKERALELCCEYIEKGAKMMNDAILCISALENDDDIQECIAKVVSCFNVNIEFVVAAVNSHRNGGHACGECKNFGNKLPLKCAYRGVNHPACDDFEQREPIAAQIFKAQNHDAVNHPSHYTAGDIECIDCIKAALGENFMGFLIGNVIKYSYRYRNKNGLEDLKKARWYLERAIKEVKCENDN